MKEKAKKLITIAKELAGNTYPDLQERHRLTHLACSVYRNRYGKKPTQSVIDYALYKLTW